MDATPDLETQLNAYKAEYLARVDPARAAVTEKATDDLRATGIESTAARVGDLAPAVSLLDAADVVVSLSSLWKQGPLVIVFYRGGWCPYCNLTLRAWQSRMSQLEDIGVSLVAISPQTPDGSLTTARNDALLFPVLSDSELLAAAGFGIAFTLPPELQALYAGSGNDLSVRNGNGLWQLPVPATFVVDRQGVIVYASVDADYRERAEPDDVIAFLSPGRALAA